MRVVRKLKAARRDLLEIFVRIGLDSENAAGRFLREAERSFDQLAAMPGIGARFDGDDERLAEVRVSSVSRFGNYLIYYRPTDDGIEVLRVLHGAREAESLLGPEVPNDEP